MQSVFRLHFDIGRNVNVPTLQTILHWVTQFRYWSAETPHMLHHNHCTVKSDSVVLPMSKCSPKTRCVTVAKSLFIQNVYTANARSSSDQRCMMTEGFKPLYLAMRVSLRHLHRCRHGAKFKSSNCFCLTLYITLMPLNLSNSVTEMLNVACGYQKTHTAA
jgi:hypothetical protein